MSFHLPRAASDKTVTRRLLTLASFAGLLTFVPGVFGQVATGWTGQGNPGTAGHVGTPGGDNWSLQTNWDGTTPGNGARDLFFGSGFDNAGANGSTTANNDLTGYSGHKINFQNATANGTNPGDHTFTITGNSFTLFDFGGATPAFPQIENDSTVLQIFNLVSASRAPQTLTLNGTGGGGKAEINPVSGALVFSSSTGIDLAGTTQLQIFGGTSGVTFNGVISSSGNGGANGVSLSPGTSQTPTVTFGAANTYTGDTVVNSGTLNFALGGSSNNSAIRLGNGSAFTATINLIGTTGGQTISSVINPGFNAATGTYALNSTNYTGTNTVSGNVFLDSSFSVNSVNAGDSRTQLTLSGNVSFQSVTRTLNLGGAGNTTLSGSFTNVANGASVLNKTGAGVLTITGDESGSGANLLKYQIGAGTLSVGSALNLPTPATNYPDKVTFNATTTSVLQATGTFTFGSFTSSSNFVGIRGQGNNTINLDVTGTNTFTLAGPFSENGGSSAVTKLGTGTLNITAPNTGAAAQGFRNNLTINGGTLQVSGAAGTLNVVGGSGSVNTGTIINGGATLFLDDTAANVNNRLAGSAANNTRALNLNGGTFAVTGNSTASTTETLGPLFLNAGGSNVTLTPNPATALTVNGTTLTRAPGATTLFRGTGLGNTPGNGVATVTLSTAPTLSATGTSVAGTATQGVIRGAFADQSATGNGAGFATYDATNGVRLLTANEQAVVTTGTAYNSAATTNNVRLNTSGNIAITGQTTNTLQIDNTSGALSTVTNTGTAFNPQNGLLFTGTAPTTLTGGTFTQATSSGDLVVYSSNSSTAGVTIGTALAGGASTVTIGGNGQITLTGAVTTSASVAFNNLGTTVLNNGTGGASTGIGNSATINNGTVQLMSAALRSDKALTIANGATLDVNNIAQTVGALNNAVTLTSLTPTTALVTNTGSTLTNFTVSGAGTFNGTIGGAINLVKASTGTLLLNNQNTYTGSTSINADTIKLGITNALPAATALTIGSGTNTSPALDLNALHQTVASLASGFTTGQAVVTNSGSTASILTVNGSANSTFAGLLQNGTGSLGLTKAGTGTLTLTANNGGTSTPNTFTGPTLIQNGTLAAAGAGALGSGTTGTASITVNNGGTLLISNSGNVSADHVNNAAPITVSGGTISVSAAAEGSRTAAGLGALTLTANSALNFNQASGGLLAFGQLIPSNFTLSVINYVGNGSANGVNQLIFTGDLQPFIDNGQLSIDGLTGSQLAEMALGNNLYELYSVTAVPEPATVLGGLLTLGALGYSQRRNARRWLSLRRGMMGRMSAA